MKKNLEPKIFIIIIFLLLVIPLIKLNYAKISYEENRNLAEFKPLFNNIDKKINWKFGLNFNTWLEDRFWGRKQLISLDRKIKYTVGNPFVRINRQSLDIIVDKHNKFLYHFVNTETHDSNTVKEINDKLKQFNDYCAKKHIKLYLVIIPHNKIVYPPGYINPDYKKSFDDTIAKLDSKNIRIIKTSDEIIKEKKNSQYPLFYKRDPHLTLDGTFICYNLLMQAIKKDYPNIKILTKNDFNYKLTTDVNYLGVASDNPVLNCDIIHVPKSECNAFNSTTYRYYINKNIKKLYSKVTEDFKDIEVFRYPKGNNLNVMVFGDSFAASLKQILPYSFKKTTIVRPVNASNFRLVKYYEKEIDETKPDIIVLYVNYCSLAKLVNLMSQEEMVYKE